MGLQHDVSGECALVHEALHLHSVLKPYQPGATLPGQYFVRKNGLANGVVQASGGLGGGVIALLLGFLITKVGTAWCLRILGLLTIICVVPAAWFIKERPGRKSTATIEW